MTVATHCIAPHPSLDATRTVTTKTLNQYQTLLEMMYLLYINYDSG